jgi:H+-translocating NAD(P) transhydrogenase subunit alpha
MHPAVKEQVQSLGGTFVAVEDEEFRQAETSGGYAKEMSKEYQAKQAALIDETIKKQDIIITTALIPGRPAPRLVTDEMIATMKPGSVIVDLAVESGGNVEGSVADEIVEKHGVRIVGHANVPSRIAVDSSMLYAKNLFALLSLCFDGEKNFALPWDDEIIKAIALTRDGAVIHPTFSSVQSSGQPASPQPSVPQTTSVEA